MIANRCQEKGILMNPFGQMLPKQRGRVFSSLMFQATSRRTKSRGHSGVLSFVAKQLGNHLQA